MGSISYDDYMKNIGCPSTTIMDNKTSGIADEFLKKLVDSIVLKANEDAVAYKPSRTYKPSSMNCSRALYYIRTGAERDEPTSEHGMVDIANSGTDYHNRIQEHVINMQKYYPELVWCDVEQYIKDNNLDHVEVKRKNGKFETLLYNKDLNLSLSLDGLIKYNGVYYIIEFKTTSNYSFTAQEFVEEKHFAQACCYSLTMNIPTIMFVYVNRNTFQKKVYLYTPTIEDKEKYALSLIRESDEHVKLGYAPRIRDGFNQKNCTYCKYKTICKNDSYKGSNQLNLWD